MKTVTDGSKVEVHLVGRLEDKTIFVSTYDGDPLEFELGDGSIIPGVEKAMVGMKVGEKREVSLEPGNGYGTRDESLVIQIEKNQVEPGIQLGDEVVMKTMDEEIPFRVTAMGEKVTIDGNHPLAGKKIHFEIELLNLPA
jgi:peptidylprolyl isomerase